MRKYEKRGDFGRAAQGESMQAREAAERAAPVWVLSGFLGAGKTSLLNRLLKTPLLDNTGFIINEFGAVGIDNALVESADEGLIELMNGCLCCAVNGDLPDKIMALLARGHRSAVPLRRIIIETTGLADPAPIMQALLGAPVLRQAIRLETVLTVADAVHGGANLRRFAEARRQIAFADKIIISKTDIELDKAKLQELRAQISALNGAAETLIAPPAEDKTAEADFIERIFAPAAQPASGTQAEPHYAALMADEPPHAHAGEQGEHNKAAAHKRGHSAHAHSNSVHAFVLTCGKPLPLFAAEQFIDLLHARFGAKILRLKAIIHTDASGKRAYNLQAVQGQIYPPQPLSLRPPAPRGDAQMPQETVARAPQAETGHAPTTPASQIVIIGEKVNEAEARRLFDSCCNIPAFDAPDRAALTDNPLAIPGYKF